MALIKDYQVDPLNGSPIHVDLMEVAGHSRSDLKDAHHSPVHHPELVTDRSIFHVIRDAGSILLHHPYQSFETSVVRFLTTVSSDTT